MNSNEKITQHLAQYTELFSNAKISGDDINGFIVTENRTKYHMVPEFADSYKELFMLIRSRIIHPNAAKVELSLLFGGLACLLRNSSIKLEHHPEADSMAESMVNSMPRNELNWQYKMLQMALVLKTFGGQDWREQYIKKLFDIPSAACFTSIQEAQYQAVIFRSLFSTCAELMECLKRQTFNDSFFEKDMQTQKSNFMWVVEVIWNLVFKESKEHMVIMDRWFEIFTEALGTENRELIFYIHMPLSHLYLNMCDTQEQFRFFNEKVEMPMAKYIQKNMRKWGFKPVKKKDSGKSVKNIAFVYDRIVGNSPTKLLMSLLYSLSRDNEMKAFVYDMGYVEKAVSDPKMVEEIKSMGITYINNHDLIDDPEKGHHYSHFDKCVKLREQALKDDIDILVMSGNRMPSGFLFATRTAPVQIFWDHGNHEYDYKNIDKRICHFDDGYRNGMEFEKIELAMLDKYLKAENGESKAEAAKIKSQLPPHDIVFGSIGRLMKLSDEYLETVAEILNECPGSIYIACGTGNFEYIKAKVKELGIEDRFIVAGWVDPHVYSHIIDIYLNTFPLVGGESVNEFVSSGGSKYVVNAARMNQDIK